MKARHLHARLAVMLLVLGMAVLLFSMTGWAVPEGFGPENEPIATLETILPATAGSPGAIILSCRANRFPNQVAGMPDNPNRWEEIIEGRAEVPGLGRRIMPGDTILLQNGSCRPATPESPRQATLRPRAGRSGQPITIKPFNGDRVTIRGGGLEPNSFTTIAGIRVRFVPNRATCPQVNNLRPPIDLDQLRECHAVIFRRLTDDPDRALSHVILRNNEIIGGGNPIPGFTTDGTLVFPPPPNRAAIFAKQGEAMLIRGNVSDVEISGNIINASGLAGHAIRITGEPSGGDSPIDFFERDIGPRHISIVGNRIEKNAFDADSRDVVASDDLISTSDTGAGIVMMDNWFREAFNIEQAIDLKGRASAPIMILQNVFDGDSLFDGSFGGEDGCQCSETDRDAGGRCTVCNPHGGDNRSGPCITIGHEPCEPFPSCVSNLTSEEISQKLPLHVVDGNTFNHCLSGSGVAIGPGGRPGKAHISNNFFDQGGDRSSDTGVVNAFDTRFSDNHFVGGGFRVGRNKRANECTNLSRTFLLNLPQQLLFIDNIFDRTRINDQTQNCPNEALYFAVDNVCIDINRNRGGFVHEDKVFESPVEGGMNVSCLRN